MDQTSLMNILGEENKKFKEYYSWMRDAMPSEFFEEVSQATLTLIVHNLIEFESQEYFSSIHLKNTAVILSLDEPDADLKLLKNYSAQGIKSYQSYVSKEPLPFLQVSENLRVTVIHFFTGINGAPETPHSIEDKTKLRALVTQQYPKVTDSEFEKAIQGISPSFLNSLHPEKLARAIAMFSRALTRDHCQYEVHYNEDWEAKGLPSMQLILAWRNTPKHNFLYRLIRSIHRHNLIIKNINASYNNPYRTDSVLVMALDLDGTNGRAAWETTNIPDFIKELITVKYFASFDCIDFYLVQKEIISANTGNFLRAMANFIHQALVHIDVNLYTLEHIEEGLCRHPELTVKLCEAFKFKFDPEEYDETQYLKIRESFLTDISKLDTGNEENDTRRKNILKQGMNFIHHTLKTNFYRPNYTSLSFRLDPKYMDEIPFDRTKKFPELPYAIFFIKGMHFFGFHIRFKDLARGGLRTVFPEYTERMVLERNVAFTECYNLAYTQQMKNKDIPEGGAKAIIFLKPYERLESEVTILKRELQASKLTPGEIEAQTEIFRQEQRLEHLYQAQRSFIESLITLVNCDEEGKLRAKGIVDYLNKPEYLYLGPDENMHDVMIEWIATYSKKSKYKPGSSFISGKPIVGINHKEYGVTSLGVNVYMDAILRFLGIDPKLQSFTIKMSGGPDGDVAGNEICNLQRYYPDTAKLIALTDVTGTIYDPHGLDLHTLVELFRLGQGIRFYPPQRLGDDSFLVDKMTKQYQTPFVQQTLCWRKQGGKLQKDWLSGSETNHLLRNNVHQTPTDIFIPGGGRPRALNETNYKEFLDSNGKPTARGIIEGANLYLNNHARKALEDLGVLIIKDSSANKTGVICSSFEVLSGLTLGDEKFVAHKPELIKEILERLRQCAAQEANLLLRTHQATGEYLTDISDRISRRINQFTDQLLDYLNTIDLSEKPSDPLIRCFLSYCLPLLRDNFQKELLHEIPEAHKKAIIACHISAQLVYDKGLTWFPSVVDILPGLLDNAKLKE